MDIEDARVLVIGARDGNINRAVSHALIDKGAKHVFEFKPTYSVRVPGDLALEIERADPTHVVYGAAINKLAWTQQISMHDFHEIMEVNVLGFVYLLQALIARGVPCSVVALTSDAAWRPMRASLMYCTSKAALEMAVRVASRELAEFGWRINAVAPGKVADTPMTRSVDEQVLQLRGWTKEFANAYEQSSSAIKRAVTKEEVAEVVISTLFGPAAQTGQVIAVNGGR